MQTSVPELIDLSKEPASIARALRHRTGQGVVREQLPARAPAGRARRSVRAALPPRLGHPRRPPSARTSSRSCPTSAARPTGRCTALLTDLKQRGLLDDTLVVWGGEFGRTPMNEARNGSKFLGRDHHPRAFTMWLAGGGIAPGVTIGAHRRPRLQRRRGSHRRSRSARDDAATDGRRPREADLPIPGPRFPADGRAWQGGREGYGVGGRRRCCLCRFLVPSISSAVRHSPRSSLRPHSSPRPRRETR